MKICRIKPAIEFWGIDYKRFMDSLDDTSFVTIINGCTSDEAIVVKLEEKYIKKGNGNKEKAVVLEALFHPQYTREDALTTKEFIEAIEKVDPNEKLYVKCLGNTSDNYIKIINAFSLDYTFYNEVINENYSKNPLIFVI